MNSYAYARNNPIVYTDPDGKLINFAAAGIGAVVGGIIGGAVAAYNNQNIWTGIGVGATVGAVGGLTFGASLAATGAIGFGAGTFTGTMAAGTMTGMTGSMAGNLLTGNKVTMNGTLSAGVAGGLTAGLAKGAGNIFTNAGSSARQAETTTVGRWMSSSEYGAMQQTGKVQAGAGGVTSVSTGGISNSWNGAKSPAVYAEFNVPTNSLIKGGNTNWFKLVSPEANRSSIDKLSRQNGPFLDEINITDLSDIIGTK